MAPANNLFLLANQQYLIWQRILSNELPRRWCHRRAPPLSRQLAAPHQRHVSDLHGKLAEVAERQPQRPEGDKPLYQHIMGTQRSCRSFQDGSTCPGRATPEAAREGQAQGSAAHPEVMEGPSNTAKLEDLAPPDH